MSDHLNQSQPLPHGCVTRFVIPTTTGWLLGSATIIAWPADQLSLAITSCKRLQDLQAHLRYNGATLCASDGTASESCDGNGWPGKSRGGAPDVRGGGEGEQLDRGDRQPSPLRGSGDSHPGEGRPGPALYSQTRPRERLEKVMRCALAAR